MILVMIEQNIFDFLKEIYVKFINHIHADVKLVLKFA